MDVFNHFLGNKISKKSTKKSSIFSWALRFGSPTFSQDAILIWHLSSGELTPRIPLEGIFQCFEVIWFQNLNKSLVSPRKRCVSPGKLSTKSLQPWAWSDPLNVNNHSMMVSDLFTEILDQPNEPILFSSLEPPSSARHKNVNTRRCQHFGGSCVANFFHKILSFFLPRNSGSRDTQIAKTNLG